MYIKYSRATALITAILIVAVVSITAITMQGYLRTELNRTQIILDSDNLLNNTYDIEAWGLAKLKKMTDKDAIWDADKTTLKITTKNYKALDAKIVPLNGMFNVNYLYDENYCSNKASAATANVINKIFENLLKNTASISNADIDTKGLIEDIQAWMCSSPKDATENINADFNRDNPDWAYQVARQFFIDISELKLATKLNRKSYINLSKYMVAFPLMTANSKVQVTFDANTMSPSLLSAIVDVPLDTARDFVESLKNKTSAEKLEAVMKYATDQGGYTKEELTTLQKYFVQDSKAASYYMIYGTATLRSNIIQMQTLVYLDKTPEVVWRKRGRYYA